MVVTYNLCIPTNWDTHFPRIGVPHASDPLSQSPRSIHIIEPIPHIPLPTDDVVCDIDVMIATRIKEILIFALQGAKLTRNN